MLCKADKTQDEGALSQLHASAQSSSWQPLEKPVSITRDKAALLHGGGRKHTFRAKSCLLLTSVGLRGLAVHNASLLVQSPAFHSLQVGYTAAPAFKWGMQEQRERKRPNGLYTKSSPPPSATGWALSRDEKLLLVACPGLFRSSPGPVCQCNLGNHCCLPCSLLSQLQQSHVAASACQPCSSAAPQLPHSSAQDAEQLPIPALSRHTLILLAWARFLTTQPL